MNTTRAVFRPGIRKVTATNSLAQYDYGQLLYIDGLDLPMTFEVDFSLDPYKGTSETRIGMDGCVKVPRALLETGETVYAFLFLHQGEDDGETRYRITIPVDKRPERGEEEVPDEEAGIIEETIVALNEGVARAASAAEQAEAARDIILNLDVDAETIEPDAFASVDKIIDEETGEVKLHFRIPQGPQGEQGDKGDTGARYTPAISDDGVLSWTNNGDLENPDPFDVVSAVLAALPAAEEARF